jgi:hypothetical protein
VKDCQWIANPLEQGVVEEGREKMETRIGDGDE